MRKLLLDVARRQRPRRHQIGCRIVIFPMSSLLHRRGQGGLQLGLVVMGQGGLENLAASSLHFIEHLVDRGLAHQDEQHRAARR